MATTAIYKFPLYCLLYSVQYEVWHVNLYFLLIQNHDFLRIQTHFAWIRLDQDPQPYSHYMSIVHIFDTTTKVYTGINYYNKIAGKE